MFGGVIKAYIIPALAGGRMLVFMHIHRMLTDVLHICSTAAMT